MPTALCVNPIDATMLESRVLFSASPIADAVVEAEPIAPSIDANSIFADDVPTDIRHERADSGDGQQFRIDNLQAEDLSPSLYEPDGATLPELGHSRELIFVDTGTEDYQQLIDDLLQRSDPTREFEVFVLDAQRDGVEQIGKILSGYEGLDAIHLVSHGKEGQVKLGNTWLSGDNVETYAREMADWNGAMRDGADLLIYGCDLAAGEEGRTLTDTISALTGADVAASDDDTGHAFLGGDWDSEFATGEVETDVAFSVDVQQNWGHLLNVAIGNTAVDTTPSFTGSDSILFDAGGGSDKYLLVGVSFGEDKGEEVDNIKFNGVGLTRIGEYEDSGVPDKSRVEIWGLANPDTGNLALDITYTGTAHEGAVYGVMSFTGVDQITSFGTFGTAKGGGSNQSVTVPTAPAELVVGVLGYSNSNDFEFIAVTGTEQWERFIGKANGTGSTQVTSESADRWRDAGVRWLKRNSSRHPRIARGGQPLGIEAQSAAAASGLVGGGDSDANV